MKHYDKYFKEVVTGPVFLDRKDRDLKSIDKVIIHCAATPPSMDVGAALIDMWHRKGNGWAAIGYHYVIKRDGTVERGRSLTTTGAHTSGYNSASVGICMVGGVDDERMPAKNFTNEQWKALKTLVFNLTEMLSIPYREIYGHNQFAAKACPSFPVPEWLLTTFVPWAKYEKVKQVQPDGKVHVADDSGAAVAAAKAQVARIDAAVMAEKAHAAELSAQYRAGYAQAIKDLQSKLSEMNQ